MPQVLYDPSAGATPGGLFRLLFRWQDTVFKDVLARPLMYVSQASTHKVPRLC